MKAQDFDEQFDRGNDISEALDLSKATRPLLEQKSLNIDLPLWMIESLNQEANRLNITPQTLIQTLLAQHLSMNESTGA